MEEQLTLDATPAEESVEAVKLNELLRYKAPILSSPSLTRRNRFSLASTAAWSLFYLCETPWIRESDGLKSQDLHILTHTVTKFRDERKPGLVQEPVLSRTFTNPKGTSNSTNVQPNDFKNDPSSNLSDEMRQNDQIKNKALLALGILLIEVCLNRNFDALRQEIRNMNISLSQDSMLDDLYVANSFLGKVYDEGGDVYGYAVQRCLRCEFPGRDETKSFAYDDFRGDFYLDVVAPIQEYYESQPA